MMRLFISHTRAFNGYGMQRRMEEVRLGTLRDSRRTIGTKVYLEDWKRDGENRKETEKMNGTFNISSCAQATVAAYCQPPSGYLRQSSESSPFCVADFSRFVLARGTPPAVSCVAVRVRSSYEPMPNILTRVFCASSNIASSLSRRGREAHMEELETHQISGCHSLVDIMLRTNMDASRKGSEPTPS